MATHAPQQTLGGQPEGDLLAERAPSRSMHRLLPASELEAGMWIRMPARRQHPADWARVESCEVKRTRAHLVLEWSRPEKRWWFRKKYVVESAPDRPDENILGRTEAEAALTARWPDTQWTTGASRGWLTITWADGPSRPAVMALLSRGGGDIAALDRTVTDAYLARCMVRAATSGAELRKDLVHLAVTLTQQGAGGFSLAETSVAHLLLQMTLQKDDRAPSNVMADVLADTSLLNLCSTLDVCLPPRRRLCVRCGDNAVAVVRRTGAALGGAYCEGCLYAGACFDGWNGAHDGAALDNRVSWLRD